MKDFELQEKTPAPSASCNLHFAYISSVISSYTERAKKFHRNSL